MISTAEEGSTFRDVDGTRAIGFRNSLVDDNVNDGGNLHSGYGERTKGVSVIGDNSGFGGKERNRRPIDVRLPCADTVPPHVCVSRYASDLALVVPPTFIHPWR